MVSDALGAGNDEAVTLAKAKRFEQVKAQQRLAQTRPSTV
jgi:hypothetical protein